jgi:very-short-patch-repair endonuclease
MQINFKNIMKKENNNLAKVYHYNLYGKRNDKYQFLNINTIDSVKWNDLDYKEPYYFFVPKDFASEDIYIKGFIINKLFLLNNSGFETAKDSLIIKFNQIDAEVLQKDFEHKSISELQSSYILKPIKLKEVKNDINNSFVSEVNYRPFDRRFTLISKNSKGVMFRPRYDTNKHLLNDNVGLLCCKRQTSFDFQHTFITNKVTERCSVSLQTGEVSYIFPLYLYSDDKEEPTREPNLNMEIVEKIAEGLGLEFVPEKFPSSGGVSAGRGSSKVDTELRVANIAETSGRGVGGVSAGRGGSKVDTELRGGNIAETSGRGVGGVSAGRGGSKVDTELRGGNIAETSGRGDGEAVSAGRGGSKVDTELRGVNIAESSGLNSAEADSKDNKSRNTQNYLNLPFNPKLKQRAKELRKAGVLSEVLLWKQLKNKQFKGYDFDRQKIIGNYIVDFYCTNCNVVIEVDGSSHDDKEEYDALRDAYLKGLGLEVIHIRDIDVKKNLDGVMKMLKSHPALVIDHPALKGTPPEEGNFDVPHSEKEVNYGGNCFTPIDILDYIYAVLHSPAYREKYKEFLKIDFPRVPYPKDSEIFWKLVKIGKEIRKIHLLESPKVEEFITSYPESGDNVVSKPRFTPSPPSEGCLQDGVVGKVFINDKQYFDGIPLVAWEFYIGGYQPAQKWLKDRKGRELSFEDIMHYQKIIVALTETDKLMKEIDEVDIV